MKISLTGKTGLIGSSILKLFESHNQNVISLGRKKCDLYLDLEQFDLKAYSNNFADILIHCAGVTDEEISSNLDLSIKKNTLGLVRLVDWAKKSGVKKFVYISSAHVYGDLNRLINEESKLRPASLYGNLHLFAENYIKSVFKDYLILRPLAVFGEVPKNFNRWSLIPFSFPYDLAKKGKITIKSHGQQKRNFISSNTIARFILTAIEESKIGVFNTYCIL